MNIVCSTEARVTTPERSPANITTIESLSETDCPSSSQSSTTGSSLLLVDQIYPNASSRRRREAFA